MPSLPDAVAVAIVGEVDAFLASPVREFSADDLNDALHRIAALAYRAGADRPLYTNDDLAHIFGLSHVAMRSYLQKMREAGHTVGFMVGSFAFYTPDDVEAIHRRRANTDRIRPVRR